MIEPKIAFCTTCKNRTQHLKLTLPQNLIGNFDAKFIILDYSSEDDLVDYLRTNHGNAIFRGNVVVYHYRGEGPFRMAHAKNMAHRLGMLEGCNVLVNVDADNLIGPGFSDYIREHFTRRRDIFLWANMIKGVLPRGISGRIAVTSQAFMKAGGYDEKYDCWSPDDRDFNVRIRALGYEGLEIDLQYVDAIRHNDKMRFKEYPHIAGQTWDYLVDHSLMPEPVSPIANAGNFGCGIVFRDFDWSHQIHLGPLPTRIFGIGMHKTATTSLHKAFEILGYESGHWRSAHWAKAIWREMNNIGRSPTLEKWNALCDLPITLLYRKLDIAYPGSKFILTVRDEQGWLETVRKHWDPDYNHFRRQWDNDPFTHQIHEKVYGRRDFDAERFLTRYRHHNATVKEYFKDRPNDLLVMEMDKGAGWTELCDFLGNLTVPQVKYPRAFSAY